MGFILVIPRIRDSGRKMDRITYEEMLEMASLGAKVLQTRSVELAMNQNVRLQVRSTFVEDLGTFVVSEEEIVEQQVVSGISHSRDEAKSYSSQVSIARVSLPGSLVRWPNHRSM